MVFNSRVLLVFILQTINISGPSIVSKSILTFLFRNVYFIIIYNYLFKQSTCHATLITSVIRTENLIQISYLRSSHVRFKVPYAHPYSPLLSFVRTPIFASPQLRSHTHICLSSASFAHPYSASFAHPY